MKVVVRVTGPVVLPSGKTETSVDLEAGATVQDLIAAIGFSPAQARFFRVAIGGAVADRHTQLEEGDQVTLMVPIGGG